VPPWLAMELFTSHVLQIRWGEVDLVAGGRGVWFGSGFRRCGEMGKLTSILPSISDNSWTGLYPGQCIFYSGGAVIRDLLGAQKEPI
jgi:hypothetical protein